MIRDNILGPSLSFHQVSLTYGNNILLDNITCEFAAGQWHGIIGPNGGGKSSLLKTLLGLQSHTGTIKIHWPIPQSPKRNQPIILKEIGYVPQLLPFDISLPISARDFLLMSFRRKPLWFNRRLSSRVMNALSLVDLNDKLDRKLGELSGGERQRLLLTCTLLKNPQLLVLDEPMTGLDRQGKKCVLALLNRFHQSGGTILMVEHDLSVIKDYCHKVYRIEQNLVEITIDDDVEPLLSINNKSERA